MDIDKTKPADVNGPYRVVKSGDFYVVGRGYCLAVDSREEGEKIVADLRAVSGAKTEGAPWRSAPWRTWAA